MRVLCLGPGLCIGLDVMMIKGKFDNIVYKIAIRLCKDYEDEDIIYLGQISFSSKKKTGILHRISFLKNQFDVF